MRKRSRAHEEGSVEAGSSISQSIFFCKSRPGRALVARSSQPWRYWAPRASVGSQIEPASALLGALAKRASAYGQAPRSNEPACRATRPGRATQHAGPGAHRATLLGQASQRVRPGAQVERASTQGDAPRPSDPARRARRPGRSSMARRARRPGRASKHAGQARNAKAARSSEQATSRNTNVAGSSGWLIEHARVQARQCS